MRDSISWDQAAASYDDARARDAVYMSCLKLVTRKVPKCTSLCLDAGAGTGLSTAALSGRCRTVVAIDYSLESLKLLRQKALPNVFVVQADLKALPFKDSAFDACVCANTLQHLRSDGPRAQAIEELRRVTRPTGVLCISVHHYSWRKRRNRWIKEGRPGQAGIDYIFRFTRRELLAALPDADVSGMGFYGVGSVPLVGTRIQAVLSAMVGKLAALLGHGHMLLAIVRKRLSAE